MKLQEEVLSSVPDTVVSVAETERQVSILPP
jgi:hypothetical protein